MHIIPGGSGRVRERGNDEEEEEIIIIMLACRFQFKDGMEGRRGGIAIYFMAKKVGKDLLIAGLIYIALQREEADKIIRTMQIRFGLKLFHLKFLERPYCYLITVSVS